MEQKERGMKSEYLKIPVDFYHRGVLIYFGPEEEFLKYIKKTIPEYYDHAVELTKEEGCEAVTGRQHADMIIYSNHRPRVETLVHELLHATVGIMEKVGIEPSADSEEAYAYLLEFLSDAALTWFYSLEPCDAQQ